MSDYKINFVWISEIDLEGEILVIKGKRTNDWKSPFHVIRFAIDDYDIKKLIKILSSIPSMRAKIALDFKKQIIEAASEGTKWTKES